MVKALHWGMRMGVVTGLSRVELKIIYYLAIALQWALIPIIVRVLNMTDDSLQDILIFVGWNLEPTRRKYNHNTLHIHLPFCLYDQDSSKRIKERSSQIDSF